MIDWSVAAALWVALGILNAVVAVIAAVLGDRPLVIRTGLVAAVSGACWLVWLLLR